MNQNRPMIAPKPQLEIVTGDATCARQPQWQLAQAITPQSAHAPAPFVPPISNLTEKQVEVLALMAEGLSNKQIARRLAIALGTVKTHVSQVLRRLNVVRRSEAIVIAQRMDSIRVRQQTHALRGEGLLAMLLPHATHATFPSGHVLFYRGEPARELFYLKNGVVTMPEVSARVGAGELFGEVGLFSADGRRTASARCETSVEAFVLTADKARELYFMNPHFAMHVLSAMAQRLSSHRLER